MDETTLVTDFKMGGRGARRWLPIGGMDANGVSNRDEVDREIKAMYSRTDTTKLRKVRARGQARREDED